MKSKLNFTEKFLLFLITEPPLPKDSLRLKIPRWMDLQLNFYASCCILSELILSNKILYKNSKITFNNQKTSEKNIKDVIFKELLKSSTSKDLEYWINYFSDVDYPKKQSIKFKLSDTIFSNLESKGMIKKENKKFLLIFNSTVVKSTENGKKYINNLIEMIKKSIKNNKYDNEMLLFILMSSENFSDMLKFYFTNEEVDIFKKQITTEFKEKNKLIFELAESFRKAFFSKG